MQEYWVNVYDYNNNSISVARFKERVRAEKSARFVPFKCLYRIHVKMKPLTQLYDEFDWSKIKWSQVK